jgi:hypothetical protein
MDEENKDGMVTPEEEMKKADEAASEPAADTDEAAA